MRPAFVALLSLVAARALAAQDAVSGDLWRVATGTLTVPAALIEEGTAPFWTPAVALAADGARFRLATEAIHGPSEVGVNGGIITFTARAGRVGTVNASYGRIGMADVIYTETSPEALGSTVPVWSQQASVGLAGRLSPAVTAGVALRYLSGRTGALSQEQFGLDMGAVFTGVPHVRLAASTAYFDPLLSANQQASSVSLGAEYRSARFPLWGVTATLAGRYGMTVLHGEYPQQLASAGLDLGALALDAGLAYESLPTDAVWRTRFGLRLRSGRFHVEIGRDGGVNGFGAAYRFGLMLVFR
jgi:hypothetical protein